nr:hypothetical protein [Halobellus litoreus]
MSEDTFERVFEPLLLELIQHHFDLSLELLGVATMEVSLNTVEVRTQADHDQVTGIGLPAAVEFHREQQGRFRDSPVEAFGDIECFYRTVFVKIAVRPLCVRLSTSHRIHECLELDFVLSDRFRVLDHSTVVLVRDILLELFLVSEVTKESIVVVECSVRDHGVDIGREPGLKRGNCPAANENIRQFGVLYRAVCVD